MCSRIDAYNTHKEANIINKENKALYKKRNLKVCGPLALD